jgi:protein-L-isoaspartate O-methyltransferase
MVAELSLLWKIARDSIAQRGVAQTLTQGPRYLVTYLRRRQAWRAFDAADGFDKQYGTDTSSMVGSENLSLDSARNRHVTPSRATRPRTFARIMQAMDIRYEDYVFVDFGSGKGRIVMLASELPFRRIIGVELSAKLHEVAQKNIALFRSKSQRGHNIELVCEDAASYPLPTDNTVFYFFDPFPLPVMSAVIENIGRSLLKHPRKVFLAYVNPTHCGAMDRSGFLKQLCSSPGGPPETQPEYPWLIYTNTTAAPSG